MNKESKVIWNKNAAAFAVSSQRAQGVVKSKRNAQTSANKKSCPLLNYSLLVSSLLLAMSGSAYAVNAAPDPNDVLNDRYYKAANGSFSIAGGEIGDSDSYATDSKNGVNGKGSELDYGIAIGARAKGFWASVAMGDTAEARSLYGTAIGPKASIDDDSDFAVSLGNNASVKTSNHGIALGANASLNDAKDSVAIGSEASISGFKNSVALGANSTVTADNTVSIGSSSNERKLVNVANGELSDTSMDAINGRQLNTVDQKVDQFGNQITANTGDINNLTSGKTGLVQLSADGKSITFDPAAKDVMVFDVSGRKVAGVAEGDLSKDSTEAINGAQLYKTDTQVEQNTGDIADLSKGISSGKAGLLQLNDTGDSLVISDTAVGAKKFNVGNRTLSGVAGGDIAANSSEAVNGSQLFETRQDVQKNSGDITDLTNGKTGLVQLDANGQSLIFGNAASNAMVFNIGNRTLSGVKDGAVKAGSTEAVNGSQLHEVKQRAENNSAEIADLKKNPGNGGGDPNPMLQMGEDGKSLVIGDAAKAATSMDLGGRTMTGVADGEVNETSTDAVNGSQLHKTNQQVSKNTTDISKLSSDISSGKTGVAQIDGDKIVFNDGNKGTTTVDVGGRNIANIKAGEVTKTSKDAVNGSQLYETNTRVDKNTANIEVNTTDIKKNQTNIASNSAKISDLESSFSGMNHSFRDLSDKVNRNKKRAEAGIAGAMAMTAIPHVNSDDFSFGMAMSGYQQQGALAAGMTFRTSEHTAMKINSAWDTQHGTGVAAGFAWGW